MVEALSVALIVLTYQGKPFLQRLLPSLLNQTYSNYHIVIVDNASTDGTIDYITDTIGSKAEIVANVSNLGCAAGYNIGAAACPNDDILCFLNQDIVLAPDYCKAIVSRFTIELDAVAVQPMVQYLDNPDLIENCGHTADVWLNTRPVGHLLPAGSFDVPMGLLFTLTAPAIRRAWFEFLGGFDESLFIYYEDTDLSLRIWEAGGRVVFEQQAIVQHLQEGSASQFPDEWRSFLWARNRLQLLWKHSRRPDEYARAALFTGGAFTLVPLLVLLRPQVGIAVARGLAVALTRCAVNRHKPMKRVPSDTLTVLRRAGVLRPSDGIPSVLRRALKP